MAEVIQFQCPSCGTLLRLPLAMGARQGPCPSCGREIIAPDPRSGTSACMVAVPDAPDAPPPFAGMPSWPPGEPASAQPLPAIENEMDSEPTPLPISSPADRGEAPESGSGMVVLRYLLTAAVAGGIGYFAGVGAHSPPPSSPPQVPSPVRASPPETPPPKTLEPLPDAANPVSEPPPAEVEEPPAKVSAGAEATLRAFLEAPDWATRSAYVLDHERVKAAMETYSHQVPDGPTEYQSITVKQSQTDELSGNTLFIFLVVTEDKPTGIPVAVAETSQGWLIDWPTFVEFRDDRFKKFAEGPPNETGRFHLIVTAPPAERAANTESEHFASFLLDPPFPGCQQLAFVKKNSTAYATCRAATASGGIFTPVLEVRKLATTDGQGYLEILQVVAPDWRPSTKD